jgi:hypothetical protein
MLKQTPATMKVPIDDYALIDLDGLVLRAHEAFLAKPEY